MSGPRGKRLHNKPWKRLLGIDRKFTSRVERAKERGAYTEPGTHPNPRNPEKVARKRLARERAVA